MSRIWTFIGLCLGTWLVDYVIGSTVSILDQAYCFGVALVADGLSDLFWGRRA